MVLPDGACLPNICLPGSDVAANVIWLNDGSVEMDSNKSIPRIVIIILGQLAERGTESQSRVRNDNVQEGKADPPPIKARAVLDQLCAMLTKLIYHSFLAVACMNLATLNIPREALPCNETYVFVFKLNASSCHVRE